MSLLEVQKVSKNFAVEGGLFRRRLGTVKALREVSFALNAGESLGLVGESGSGKTTLAKILTRMIAPDGGRLLWEGRTADTFSPREWAGNVQMVFQDPSASLNPKLSVETLLSEPLALWKQRDGRGPVKPEDMVAILQSVGLPTDILSSYPHQFSGGQKQRLAIARALAARPRLLVADEPVSALDLSIQAQILNLILDLKEKFGLTIVIISHDLAVVSYLADNLMILKDGEAVEAGPAQRILTQPEHEYTRRLLEAVPALVR